MSLNLFLKWISAVELRLLVHQLLLLLTLVLLSLALLSLLHLSLQAISTSLRLSAVIFQDIQLTRQLL